MELIRKTLAEDAPIHDPSMMCDQLAVGIWVVEASCKPIPAHDPAGVPAWRQLAAGVAISVSSGTALRLGLGAAMIAWLGQTGRAVGPLAGLALHELIVNAAVHGNLGATFSHLDTWQDVSMRQATVTTLLEDVSRAGKLVTIALGWRDDRVVAIVSDEGHGYRPDAQLSFGLGSGRGLRIARAAGTVAVLQGGRQTVLTLVCQAAGTDR